MTKSTKRPVNIKDLPAPKGYSIVGGSGKRKDLEKEETADTPPTVQKLPR